MRMPMSTRRYLLRVGRPGGLGLLEVLDRFVLDPVGERLVAGFELLAGLPEILPLGLRLLVLGVELLLDLDRGLGPHGRGQREREGDGGGAEHVSHRVSPLGWPWCRALSPGRSKRQAGVGLRRLRCLGAGFARAVRRARERAVRAAGRAGSGPGQVAVLAPEEDERAPVARLRMLDLADVDHVVAALERVEDRSEEHTSE